MTTRIARSLALLLGLALAACSDDSTSPNPPREDLRAKYGLEPFTYDDVPYPPGNSPAEEGYPERVELGRLLFFDHLLSGNHDVSCGTCHHPAFAWADGRELGAGVTGVGLGPDRVITDPRINVMPRNVPTNINVAFSPEEFGGDTPSWKGVLFWDGRERGLEVQALQPVATFDEMRHYAYPDSAADDTLVARLRQLGHYEPHYRAAFPADAAVMDANPEDPSRHVIRNGTTERALAAYQRELVALTSDYDRYLAGDDYALSESAFRGLDLFFGKADCGSCHYGPMLSGYEMVRTGVEDHGPGRPPISHGGDGTDPGYSEHTYDPRDRYKFRTPGLRNVELTGPYFRNGVEHSLRGVVEYFNAGVATAGFDTEDFPLDPRMRPLNLTEEEIDDIVAFMRSLTDTTIDSPFLDPEVPTSVPSGLPPVERIAPFSRVPSTLE